MSLSVVIYILVSVTAISILAYFLYKCENNSKSNFCMCGGIADVDKNCRSPAQSRKLYSEGNTEYSQFAKPPGWGKRPSWM